MSDFSKYIKKGLRKRVSVKWISSVDKKLNFEWDVLRGSTQTRKIGDVSSVEMP